MKIALNDIEQMSRRPRVVGTCLGRNEDPFYAKLKSSGKWVRISLKDFVVALQTNIPWDHTGAAWAKENTYAPITTLTERETAVLSQIGAEWACSLRGVSCLTLESLLRKKLIEQRRNPKTHLSAAHQPMTARTWHYRKTPTPE